jgi:hypothetical protein
LVTFTWFCKGIWNRESGGVILGAQKWASKAYGVYRMRAFNLKNWHPQNVTFWSFLDPLRITTGSVDPYKIK